MNNNGGGTGNEIWNGGGGGRRHLKHRGNALLHNTRRKITASPSDVDFGFQTLWSNSRIKP